MTVTERQAELPAVSVARTIIRFVPVNSGMSPVLQDVVPAATPDFPVDVSQVTLATPELSLAVPRNAIVEAEVKTVGVDGEVICSDGAVVSFPLGV